MGKVNDWTKTFRLIFGLVMNIAHSFLGIMLLLKGESAFEQSVLALLWFIVAII